MSLHLNNQNIRNIQAVAADKRSVAIYTKVKVAQSIRTIATLLIVAYCLRASVVEAFKIPSQSMTPTLLVGDHILVNKLSYGIQLPLVQESVWQFSAPKRGDVVVFTRPDDPLTIYEDEAKTNIIKRVIGLAGDTVEVKGTHVYINGKLYMEDDKYSRWLFGGSKDFSQHTVPAGKVFLLGDNRDESKDSRFWNDPFLDINRIKGRAFIVYWNWNDGDPLTRIFQAIH